MNEKNTITISVSKLIFIIAIILIIILGVIIYNNLIRSSNETQQALVSTSETKNLENTISSPKTSEDVTSQPSLSTCQSNLEDYLNLVSSAKCSPEDILDDLGLLSYGDFDYENTIENGDFILTNVKYDDFENSLLKYATKDCITSEIGHLYKNSNGFVAVLNGGGSSREYTIKNMTLLNSTNTSATYNVDYSYITGEYEETGTLTATFELSNGNWVISGIILDEELEYYLNLVSIAKGAPESLLIKLGFLSDGSLDYENTIEDGNFILTNVKYDDFENSLLKYATKDCITSEIGHLYKNSNGFVAVLNGGGSAREYTIKNMTLLNSTDISATYNVDYSYITGEYEETGKLTVYFELSNGNWVISNIIYDK